VEGKPTNLAGKPAVARENSKGSEDRLPLRASLPSPSSFRKPPPTQGPALQVRAGRVKPLRRGEEHGALLSRANEVVGKCCCLFAIHSMHGLPPLASWSHSRWLQLLKCS
jgi:hypothetical protein